jgi:hypothetical protein
VTVGGPCVKPWHTPHRQFTKSQRQPTRNSTTASTKCEFMTAHCSKFTNTDYIQNKTTTTFVYDHYRQIRIRLTQLSVQIHSSWVTPQVSALALAMVSQHFEHVKE